jgi:hypothetical protein
MARRKSLRSQLYRAARELGNVQAARGGPTSYGNGAPPALAIWDLPTEASMHAFGDA